MGGRSLRIFLVDGTASGVRTAELGLSTIKAIVVPRASLSTAAKRSELAKTGVYVLLGPDADRPGGKKMYIGEGDTLITRLTAHNKDQDKDFWTEAVAFLSKDETLTKGHTRFLEARLIKLATDAKRCILLNGTAPTDIGRLPEPDEVEMAEFIEQARLLLGALGYDVFEALSMPTALSPSTPATNGDEFQFEGDGFSARCVVDSGAGQFVVRAGSVARKVEAGSLSSTYRNSRSELLASGVLVDKGDTLEFTQDYAFGAPSAAAAVVSGQTVSGRTAWKLRSSGETFAEWEERNLPKEQDSAS